MKDRKISELRNLGPKSEEWLGDIGIRTEADLIKKGPVQVYKAFCKSRGETNLNMLWALVGATMDLSWKDIPQELKEKLIEEVS